jgi:hypothetical protein
MDAKTMDAKKRESERDPAAALPHYHGHRERLRERFRAVGPDALSDYELLEAVLFRALPRRDVKPLAKTLIATFGSFAASPHRRRGSPRSRVWARPRSPSSRSSRPQRAGCCAAR